ncbi:hypothetical protein GGR27_001662 [Lewinella antarctica]|uniref:Secretion system C-terminal sorting domain-containing protein n=1 Tax=Neolewinella antarctica TaxID=442734 RepID=A0ABX0XBF4_9BACT|nr:hypothetical protein [Neolewinella antarctica]
MINAETARALKQRYVIRWTAILSASQRDSTTTNVVLYGEEANTIPQFTVSPNPAQDWVNVTSAGDIQQILVYDITGQLLQQHVGIASFSTSTLPAATYVISVEFADGKIGSRKLVKQ